METGTAWRGSETETWGSQGGVRELGAQFEWKAGEGSEAGRPAADVGRPAQEGREPTRLREPSSGRALGTRHGVGPVT